MSNETVGFNPDSERSLEADLERFQAAISQIRETEMRLKEELIKGHDVRFYVSPFVMPTGKSGELQLEFSIEDIHTITPKNIDDNGKLMVEVHYSDGGGGGEEGFVPFSLSERKNFPNASFDSYNPLNGGVLILGEKYEQREIDEFLEGVAKKITELNPDQQVEIVR